MTEDDLLERYGLRPAGTRLDEVRGILAAAMRTGPDPDTDVMRLCCVQLFHHGSLDDVLLIWQAKESGWDAHCSIDVQLLCGAGLAATEAFLAAQPGDDARQALDYLTRCEAAGDFTGFTVEQQSTWYHRYYDRNVL